MLNSNILHPFHYTPVQELLPADLIARETFCRSILRRNAMDALYLNSILWTDESQFTRDGINNFHNLHYWSEQNPHVFRQRSFQHRFSLNVWAAIMNQTIIGPIFLPARLTAENYLQHLRQTVGLINDEVPINVRNRIVYQHDGAPAHTTAAVRNFLNSTYEGRVIGRLSETAWPPRSPDLTPMDFFLWSYIKSIVYGTIINTEDQLRQNIIAAFDTAKENMGNINLMGGVERRYTLCIVEHGGHIEHLL